jgi:O-antigen/teichoic acid export membrane protein
MEKLKKFLFNNLSPKQTILKNTFWLYFSEIVSKGLRLLVFIYIIRILGPQNFGVFEYFLSLVGIFFLFADFGTSTIFIREYQQQQDKEKQTNIFFSLKIILAVIFSLLALGGYFFSKKFDSFLFYFSFVLFYFLMHIENFFESFFIAIEKTEKKFIFNTLMSLFLFIFVFIGLTFFKNILAVILAYILSAFLGIIFAYFLTLSETKIKFFFDPQLVKYYLYDGFPLVLFGLLDYIFFTTDKIILAHLRSIEEVGYYSLASRILSVLFVIPYLFNTALYPYLAKKIGEKEEKKIKSLFKNILLGLFLGGILIAVLIFILSPIIIPIFFGNKYNLSIEILQTFVWIIVFVFPTNFLDYFLISNHRQWLDFWITIIPAFLNVILNFILIPFYGVYGAVYSSILAQALNFVLTFIASVYILKNPPFTRTKFGTE